MNRTDDGTISVPTDCISKTQDPNANGFHRIPNIILTDYIHRKCKNGNSVGYIGYAIYCCLVKYAYGNKTFCFPSQETIWKELEMGESTLTRYLPMMEEIGMIKKSMRYKNGKKVGCTYELLVLVGSTPESSTVTEKVKVSVDSSSTVTEKVNVPSQRRINNYNRRSTNTTVENTVVIPKTEIGETEDIPYWYKQ